MDLCLFAHLVYYAHYYRHVNWCFSFLGPSIFEFKMGQTVVKFFVLFVRLHAEKLKRKTGCHPTGICVCRSHILQLYVCLWSEVGFNSIVNSSIKDHFACKPTLDTRAVGRVRVGCWGRGFGIGLHFSSAVQINLHDRDRDRMLLELLLASYIRLGIIVKSCMAVRPSSWY